MPGHAFEPAGISEVVTVQFDAVELTVNPVGNTIWTLFSVPLSDEGVVVHKSPPVEADIACLSSLM